MFYVQTVHIFVCLLVLCSIQFISPQKMRDLILRRKTGTVSVEVFTFHVHLAFERHTGTEDVSSTFVQCLFCKNSFAFRADFFCINVTKYTN